ncbi:MAG: COX15/CtaA family protein [Pelomonas sp.]|nr:COX15/CtaA family protein [Roseateles sp.]
MNPTPASYDLSPLGQVLLIGAFVATLGLAWLWSRGLLKQGARGRGHDRRRLLAALTVLTLFVTFDLIVFGAFTRLSDSGLGCPDWPGCYGQASPVGAHAQIADAQAAMPTGPVTHGKAWVEMVHRYLATGVGGLILVLAGLSLAWRRHGIAPWWALASLVAVCVQGAFGALTVTMKLFPAIVTTHLALGLGLMVLLVWQAEAHAPQPLRAGPGLRRAAALGFGLAVVQVLLGGWVSTNYAVLACNDFPACQVGAWWPEADFAHGFTLWRPLGGDGAGGLLSFAGLVAIHLAHRCGAAVVTLALLGLSAALARAGAREWALRLLAVLAWQLASGVATVLLAWPLAVALAHTAGAAMLLMQLATLLARLRAGAAPSSSPNSLT